MLVILLLAIANDPADFLPVPPGFEIKEFASAELANNIHSITLDPQGRLTVASPGTIQTLIDDDSDGRADRAIAFATGPPFGAMGLLWNGNELFVSADNAVLRYQDIDGDLRADAPPKTIVLLKHGGEHGVHAIRLGPDGNYYLLCGNESGVDARFAETTTSPIRQPIAGCLLRFNPDWKQSEILADGFRNPYDFDFHTSGEIFTYDSDNERCVSLPWYEPTRFYHVVPGGHYGWQGPNRAQTWRMPPTFPDIVPPIANLRRGSPTGVACYRHLQFPERYRGGFFVLDWTFGRVWFLPLEPHGATLSSKPEIFLQATGQSGFAPTDIVVHPTTGDLYISIGGRGTRGSIYRIRYTDGFQDQFDPVQLATLQPHPRNPDPSDRFTKFLDASAAPTSEARLRLQFESATRSDEDFDDPIRDLAVSAGINHHDRLVRQAAAGLIARRTTDSDLPAVTLVALPHLLDAGYSPQQLLHALLSLESDFLKSDSAEAKLAYVRAAQQLVGDCIEPKFRDHVWAGYSIRSPNDFPNQLPKSIVGSFPTGNPVVDIEIARLAAMCQTPDTDLVQRILFAIKPDTDPVQDIHYLITLSRLPAKWNESCTNSIAVAMLALEDKFLRHDLRRDRNWPIRMREMHEAMATIQPSLNRALLASPQFGQQGHLVWTHATGFDRAKAAEVFLTKAQSDADGIPSTEYLKLLAELPTHRIAQLLRQSWSHVTLRAEIVRLLAQEPSETDRPLYLQWLASGQIDARKHAVRALQHVGVPHDKQTASALLKAIRSTPKHPKFDRDTTPAQLADLLAQSLEIPPPAGKLDDWLQSVTDRYSDQLQLAESASEQGIDEIHKRLQSINWDTGDPQRGRAVYNRLGCRDCHTGALASGPDLTGIQKRFSKNDLINAIVEPNRDIPDRYKTTTILTLDGRTYFGIIVYEAVDSTLLLLRDGQTVRIAPQQVEMRLHEPKSLMPADLLQSATDAEIADLFAYLYALDDPATP